MHKEAIIMTNSTRQEILTVLQEDWAGYVRGFRRMTPESQSAFLARQGYARFADLLAHIVAWWEVGYRSIEKYLAEPSFQPGKYDVNAFNAEAVARSAGLGEDDVVASFEKMRLLLVDFVKQLPDAAFENEKVVNQLNMELAGHLAEHRLPES
jgi:hypothetical protein